MPQPADHRIFLGLTRPPLVSAAAWLVDTFQNDSELDLSQKIVVLPSSRAQQRVVQLLIRLADQRQLVFTPPVVTTVGQLPEYLYVAEKQLATDLAQQIAWSKALEQTPKEEIQCLTGRPEVEDLQDWQPLATLISKLHTRLANDIWSFRSVANKVKDLTGFLHAEEERWQALKSIQERYYTVLYSVDLWDKQAARNYAAAGLLKAVPQQIRCATDKHIIMLGAADLNLSITEMLRQVSSVTPEQISILVAGDPDMAHRFDDFGSLITEEWIDIKIEFGDDQILIVDQPADQADATAQYLCTLDFDFSADQATIGIPDESLVPQLQRSLNAIDVPHRNLAGRQLSETAPVRLMIACKEFLRFQNYDTFAALVRHPDMFRWLHIKSDADGWLQDLDIFQNNYLPNLLSLENHQPFGSPADIEKEFDETDRDDEARAKRKASSTQLLNQIHRYVGELLTPLIGEPQSIGAWSKPWSEILIQVYGDRVMDKHDQADRQIIKACDAIYTALGNQKQVPKEFETLTRASEALDWAIEAATEHRIVDPPIPDAIELAGWLDLTLDDAPVMVVTSMNDEHVPTSEIGHQFLPNELCKTLKILDNDRRYARDAYALTVITSVREHVKLICGRRDEKGEPKKPSRLLFTTDHQTAARRAKAFFSYKGKPTARKWITSRKSADFPDEQQFEIPMPSCTEPPPRLSVTKFKSFIQCPYRFYLNHIMKLDKTVDDWRELSGGTFGDLTHAVVEAFGKHDLRDSTNAGEILEFFNDKLDYFVSQKFFGSRLPAVRIQIEQLRQRLERFAVCQVEHRKQGWRIVSTEEHLFHNFMVDDEPFVINGKIDRVDQHETTGQIAVWDYKSSDKGEGPESVHYAKRKQEWKDLQLPLYRHLVKEVEVVKGADYSNVVMGYILLPKQLDSVGFHPVSWPAEQLQTADDEARSIIRKLREGKYWPPKAIPPMYSQDFAAICQDDVFEEYDTSFAIDDDSEEAPPW